MWLLYSILTIAFWGMWGFLIKVASRYMEWYQLYVLSNLVSFILSAGILLWGRQSFATLGKFALYGIAAGLLGTMGYIFFILAIRSGKVSIVVPLTATYPVITFLLGIAILREQVQIHHLLGTILAIAGAILLSL